jgi:hypothetical protein
MMKLNAAKRILTDIMLRSQCCKAKDSHAKKQEAQSKARHLNSGFAVFGFHDCDD